MNESALAKLKRTTLQHLAKREGIRANAKSVDLIDLLLIKYPHGVPRLQPQSSERLEQGTPEKDLERRRLNVPTPDIVAAANHEKDNTRSILPSPSRSENVVWSNKTSERSLPRVPGNKDVRFVKREISRLVDEGVAIRQAVNEAELLVAHAMSVANEMSKDIREISWMRYCVEMDIVYKLKHDQTLWDGTRLMSDGEM